MATTTEPADTTADKAAVTGYIILAEQHKPGAQEATVMPTGGWDIVARNVEARSAEAAVRQFAEKNANGKTAARVLVAIPVRSWKPLRVTPKVTTTLNIEDAT